MSESNPKIKKLGLRKNFMWMTGGTVISAMANMGLLTITQKMLGTEAVGTYTLATAISMPIFLFTSLSLGRVMVVDVTDTYNFGEYLGVRLFLNIVAILIIVGVVFGKQYSATTAVVICAMAVYQALITIIQASQAVFQKHECMNYIGISSILQSFLCVLGLILGIYITGTLVGGILAVCILVLLKFVFYDLCNLRHFGAIIPHFSFPLLKGVIKECWVISIASGLASFSINVPRYIIEGQLGVEYLGYFAGICSVTMGVMLVVVSLVSSALRRLSVYFSTDLHKFRRLLFKLVVIAVCFGLANILFTFVAGRFFLTIFFDKTYTTYIGAMYLFAVAGTILGVVAILGDTIFSTRRYWWRVIANVASLIVIYLSSGFLIARYALNGITLACILGFSVEMLLCIVGLIVLTRQQRKNHVMASESNRGIDIISEVSV